MAGTLHTLTMLENPRHWKTEYAHSLLEQRVLENWVKRSSPKTWRGRVNTQSYVLLSENCLPRTSSALEWTTALAPVVSTGCYPGRVCTCGLLWSWVSTDLPPAMYEFLSNSSQFSILFLAICSVLVNQKSWCAENDKVKLIW